MQKACVQQAISVMIPRVRPYRRDQLISAKQRPEGGLGSASVSRLGPCGHLTEEPLF